MKADNELVLALDCGTQSLRALLFSKQGTLEAKEKIEYIPYVSEYPGGRTDPLVWGCLVQDASIA